MLNLAGYGLKINTYYNKMKTVRSFDIFDTLLARTVQDPLDIYSIIEKNYPYPNFRHIRHTAHVQSNNTIADIYKHFQRITGDTDELIAALRAFELRTEMENTIPIMTNISKIQDGDILVSDMYLTHDELIKLLHYHKIDKDIKLFVRPDGKSSGRIWPQLLNDYSFVWHIGDNPHSDIAMAKQHNIPTIFTTVHKFTSLESQLIHIDFNLCRLLRTFRLSNPYEENTTEYLIFSQQIEYNIPLLLFICRSLNVILKEENRTTVLFVTRDGCLIKKLFNFLYPEYSSITFHSSRIINSNYNEDYKQYIKRTYNKDTCILFDLHGSFKSGRKLFLEVLGELPRVLIFDLAYKEYKYSGMTNLVSVSNQIIEDLNQDTKGTLVNFIGEKDIRMPPDWPLSYLDTMATTIKLFIQFLATKKDYVLSTNTLENALLWSTYYENTVCKITPLFLNKIDKTECTLKKLSTKYNCAFDTNKFEILIDNCITKFPSEKIRILDLGKKHDHVPCFKEYFSNNVDIDTKVISSHKYHIIIDDTKELTNENKEDHLLNGGFYIDNV